MIDRPPTRSMSPRSVGGEEGLPSSPAAPCPDGTTSVAHGLRRRRPRPETRRGGRLVVTAEPTCQGGEGVDARTGRRKAIRWARRRSDPGRSRARELASKMRPTATKPPPRPAAAAQQRLNPPPYCVAPLLGEDVEQKITLLSNLARRWPREFAVRVRPEPIVSHKSEATTPGSPQASRYPVHHHVHIPREGAVAPSQRKPVSSTLTYLFLCQFSIPSF